MLKPVIAVYKVIKTMQPQNLDPSFKRYNWIHSLSLGRFLTTGNKEHKLQTSGVHYAHQLMKICCLQGFSENFSLKNLFLLSMQKKWIETPLICTNKKSQKNKKILQRKNCYYKGFLDSMTVTIHSAELSCVC